MKNAILKYLIPALGIVLTACAEHSEGDYDIPERQAFADSIKNANYSWVASCSDSLADQSLASGDSLKWAYYLNESAATDYLQGKFPAVMPKLDRVSSWIARQLNTGADISSIRNLIRLSSRLRGGYFQSYDFNPDSAVHYQDLALRYTLHSNPNDYVLSIANLADAYKLSARYAEASDLYHQAVLFSDSAKIEPKYLEMVYSGLAGVYSAMGDYDEAQPWWDRTMRYYPTMVPYAKFANLNNLGNHYYKAEEYEKSLSTFLRLYSFLDSIGASDWERNFCRTNLADVYLSLGKNERATELLDTVTEYFETAAPSSIVLAHIHNLQMRLATNQGDTRKVRALLAAHPLADSIRNEQLEGRLKAMEYYYKNSGQWKEAYEASERLHAIKDSVVSKQVRQALGAHRLAYERDTRLLTLQADNSSNQTRLFRLGMILGLSLLALALLAVWIAVWRLRERRHEDRMYRKIMDLRMESVRTRITPHFIYNVLNQELLARSRDEESHLPAIVSLLRRQQLIGDRILIPLAEELDFLRDYLATQGLRSDVGLQFSENIQEGIDIDAIQFPSMTLQILAENAFKHGFPTLPAGVDRRLWLDISKEDGRTYVRLTNNCATDNEGRVPNNVDKELAPGGLGLRIITETIAYIDSRYRLRFKFSVSQDPGFYTAEISF